MNPSQGESESKCSEKQCDSSRTGSNQVVIFFGDASVDNTVDQHFTRALSHWPKSSSPTHSESTAENENDQGEDVFNTYSSPVSPTVHSSPEPSDQPAHLSQTQFSQDLEPSSSLLPQSSLDFSSTRSPVQPQLPALDPQPWPCPQPKLSPPYPSLPMSYTPDIQPPPLPAQKQLLSVPAAGEMASKQHKLTMSRSYVKGPLFGPYTVPQPSYNTAPLTHLSPPAPSPSPHPSLQGSARPLIPSYPAAYPVSLAGHHARKARHRSRHFSSMAPHPPWASGVSFDQTQMQCLQKPRRRMPPPPLEPSSLGDKSMTKLIYPEFTNYLVQPEVDTFEDIPRVFGENKDKELASHLPPPQNLFSDTTAPSRHTLNLSGPPYNCLAQGSSAYNPTPTTFMLQQSFPMYDPTFSLPMTHDSGSSSDSSSQQWSVCGSASPKLDGGEYNNI